MPGQRKDAPDSPLPSNAVAELTDMAYPAPGQPGAGSRRLSALVFTTVFPNSAQPLHGTFVLERVRHLAALADVRVVAPVPWHRTLRGGAGRLQIPSVPVTHPRFWYVPRLLKAFDGIFLFASAVREVGRLRRSFDFDLIDAHFAFPDGFAAILLGLWFRRPVCITLRGTIIPLSRHPVRRRLCDWAIRRAERVIAVADNLAERAQQGGFPKHRIETIPNGVDAERFRPTDRATARQQLGIPEHGSLLVSIGHLSRRKGFHRLIRSLPRVIGSNLDVRLAIVGGKGGEEDNSAELRSLVQQLGLADRVMLAGAQARNRVVLWLGAADVFVLASDFEGCPNVILEAMACGRPVVATKVGHIARMVPEFAGILIENPDDDRALSAGLIEALGGRWNPRRIREHVTSQSWDDVAQRVIAQWRLAVTAFVARSAGDPATPPPAISTALPRISER